MLLWKQKIVYVSVVAWFIDTIKPKIQCHPLFHTCLAVRYFLLWYLQLSECVSVIIYYVVIWKFIIVYLFPPTPKLWVSQRLWLDPELVHPEIVATISCSKIFIFLMSEFFCTYLFVLKYWLLEWIAVIRKPINQPL